MKFTDINLEKTGYNFSANKYPKFSHTGRLLKIGRCFPICKAQAKKFKTFDVLNLNDVIIIENFLNKHGFSGSYQYTKSKTWARLNNIHDFYKALKIEFNF